MDRFWTKVARGDGCWEWQAARFINGQGQRSYGMFHVRRGKVAYAHRISWELTHGPIPDGLLVLHACDNRACVRPDHLYLGSHADNTRDAVERDRMSRGEDRWNHKLTAAKVRAIRLELARGRPTEDIGPEFGVTGRTVRYIRDGRRWASVK